MDELEAQLDNIDFEAAAAREREVRHDVMAHVYAYGLVAPKAAGIIHLGATSCYITDNADVVLYREGLRYLRAELLKVVSNLAAFADKYKATPTLGYTHYQPAQLVTIGKRATLWMQDLMSDMEELDFVIGSMKFLGCRGTTGTEASFMDLYNGDEGKIDEMNRLISRDFGFERCFSVCGQTYPRKLDSRILNVLSSIGQSCMNTARKSSPSSATPACSCGMHRRRARRCCLRHSWVRCGIWITAFTPTPLPPTPSRPMPLLVLECPT